MKKERCPRCGALLPVASAPCPECGYGPSLKAEGNDLASLDSAFGDLLKAKEDDEAIVKNAKSMENSDPLGAITLYRKAIMNRNPSAFAEPYFSFLVSRWEHAALKKENKEEGEQLLQGYELLQEKNLLETLSHNQKLLFPMKLAERAVSYRRLLSFAKSVVAKLGPKNVKERLPEEIEKQIDEESSHFDFYFVKIAIASNLYDTLDGVYLDSFMKSITRVLDIPLFLKETQDPLIAPYLRPFRDFYLKWAGKRVHQRFPHRTAVWTNRLDEDRREAEKEEKNFRELSLLNGREAALEAKTTLGWTGKADLRKALESLRKGEGFWLRNVFIQVLDLQEKKADVAFIWPYLMPFDRRALAPIAYGKPGFMDKLKKKPTQDGKLLLREGSVPLYENSEIRLALNKAIWNELPAGMEDVFEIGENGDRFVLISKSEIELLKNKGFLFEVGESFVYLRFWLRDVSPQRNLGNAEIYCLFSANAETGAGQRSEFEFWPASELAYPIVRSTLDISKFEEWERDVESYFEKILDR